MIYITAFLFASIIFALVVLWSLAELYAESKKQEQFDL
ncbi:Heme exporter protein D [Acinetobacter pragensis]